MKRGIAAIVSCLFMAALMISTTATATEYDHTIEVKKMSFSWKVDGKNLIVKLTGKTTGWVGIGFNPTKKMKDANYVLGYVKKGEAKIRDDFGTGDKKHAADKKLGGTEDATLISGSEEGGVTTIEFSLPLATDDANDATIDPAGDTIVLLAYGGKSDRFSATHKYRTTLKVNLSNGSHEKVGK